MGVIEELMLKVIDIGMDLLDSLFVTQWLLSDSKMSAMILFINI